MEQEEQCSFAVSSRGSEVRLKMYENVESLESVTTSRFQERTTEPYSVERLKHSQLLKLVIVDGHARLMNYKPKPPGTVFLCWSH